MKSSAGASGNAMTGCAPRLWVEPQARLMSALIASAKPSAPDQRRAPHRERPLMVEPRVNAV